MPFRDGTGPNGQGSMTGWGFGNCNPNQINRTPRRGIPPRGGRMKFGRGFGTRRYNRNRGAFQVVPVQQSNPDMSNISNIDMLKQEKNYLESQMDQMKQSLNDIQSRISKREE